MQDNTEKQNNKSSFQYSDEHFKMVQKITHLGSWTVVLDTGKISASSEACRIYGVEFQDYDFQFIETLVLPEFRAFLNDAMLNLLEGSIAYDVEFQIKRHSDGEVRDIHSIAEYDKGNRTVTGVIHDITGRKTVERAQKEREAIYRILFKNSVSGIIYADIEGNILEVNSKMLEFLGAPSLEDTLSINVLTFPPLADAGFSADFKKVIETSSVVHGSTKYQSKWGADNFLEYVLNPVKSGSKITGIIGKIENITQRKLSEEKIQSLLVEKDILLREIHHRLKNNMASIESLLKIQLSSSDDEQVNAPIADAVVRLSSMRVLYDKLYLSTDFIHLSIEDYLSSLVDEIFEVFPGSTDVEVVKNIQNFMVPSDDIFPLGLMINELLTNTFKYAFKDIVRDKQISISVSNKGGSVTIIVRDNGMGYPETGGGASGFGLQLIRMLAKQIGGNVDFRNDDGAVCTIVFEIDS